jgi:hypothetical protein
MAIEQKASRQKAHAICTSCYSRPANSGAGAVICDRCATFLLQQAEAEEERIQREAQANSGGPDPSALSLPNSSKTTLCSNK